MQVALDSQPLWALEATALGSAFANGQMHPWEVVQACLGRIAGYDGQVGACNQVAQEAALRRQAEASADRWRRGAPLSPLDGVPFGVKANIAVQGMAWHGGIGALAHQVASQDAACVARLRDAGLIPLAICNMHEAALGVTSNNSAFGATRNPHDLEHIPGGSSGGSAAAVAAGFLPIALGTDDLGSVRLPSALCGIVGFKPAYGELSNAGVIPLAPSLDHVGVHARSVADVAAVMGLIGGVGEHPVHGSLPPPTWTAWRLGGQWPADGPVAAAFADLSAQQETVRSIRFTGTTLAAAFARLLAQHNVSETLDWSDIDLAALRRAGLLLCERAAANHFAALLREHPQGFSQTLRDLLAWGVSQPQEKAQRAQALVEHAGQRLRKELANRLLLNPTTLHQAPRRDAEPPVSLADLTAPAAIAGLPSISVPWSDAAPGLPLGLQITGADSAQVLKAAAVCFPGSAATARLDA